MNLNRRLAAIGLTVLVICMSSSAAGQNLVVNGSFEADSCTSAVPGQRLGLVGNAVTGWFIPASDGVYPWCLQNNVNIYGAGPTPFGNQWLVLGEVGRGVPYTIQQTITGTIPGKTYKLTFAIASEFGCCSIAEVSFLNGSSTPAQNFTAPLSGQWWTAWATQTMNFTATDNSVTLQFKNLVTAQSGGIDLGLDNVDIEDASLAIIQPNDQNQFALTQSSLTATSPIAFEAGPIAPSATIQWTAQLQYATSGGRGSFTNTRKFTTDQSTTIHNETYTGIGGQVTVKAKQDTPALSANPITIFIVGTAIPDSDITNRLVALYGGATSHLMTGIAVRESSYQQFATITLFGVSARWPHESYDGGSHIGLMQMPINQANAWDWTANTSNGVNLFNSKLASAGRIANRIIGSHPGLRQLTAVELEHMAVVLYGEHASANLSAQYYAPVRTATGGWDWAKNTAGNPKGVAYADFVFSNTR